MASSFLCGNISTLVLILGSKAKRLGKRKHCNSGPSILPNKDLRVQLSLLGTFLELSAISAVSGFEICRKTESTCNRHLSAIIWHGIAESIKEGKINSHEKKPPKLSLCQDEHGGPGSLHADAARVLDGDAHRLRSQRPEGVGARAGRRPAHPHHQHEVQLW